LIDLLLIIHAMTWFPRMYHLLGGGT